MKWQEIELKALQLSEQEVGDQVRSLTADVRFPALVRMLLDQKRLASDSACTIQFADHHGCLAHAAGVQYGMLEIIGKLKEAQQRPKRRGQQPPENGHGASGD